MVFFLVEYNNMILLLKFEVYVFLGVMYFDYIFEYRVIGIFELRNMVIDFKN